MWCAFMLLSQLVYDFFSIYLFISLFISKLFFPIPLYFREASGGPFESETSWRLHSAFLIPLSKKLHLCVVSGENLYNAVKFSKASPGCESSLMELVTLCLQNVVLVMYSVFNQLSYLVRVTICSHGSLSLQILCWFSSCFWKTLAQISFKIAPSPTEMHAFYFLVTLITRPCNLSVLPF